MSTKVLVADDSGVMRKIIMRSLNAVGVTDITEAADGAEAVTKFSQGQFDLVLTDWNMPNMSGIDVIRQIRSTGSKVPIFMVTTEAEKKSVVEAIQVGVTDYLTKPFENDTLRTKLQKYVAV